MKIEIRNRCSDYQSYRAARVKSLFNVETGCDFDLDAVLPIGGFDWSLGVIVGPSGSGKTSLGREMFGAGGDFWTPAWPGDAPIIDAIDADGDFDDVTAALAAVGLGDVPAWLRPYRVLSNGEKFRADLARLVCEAPAAVVVDEFTSVVDRQVARFGAMAFAKAWRRLGYGHRAVLLTPHRDVLEWLEADWIYDTADGTFSRRRLRRPSIEVEIFQTDWRYWPEFEPHHYLKLPNMIAATNYVGTVEGERVVHLAVSTRPGMTEARAARFVVLPEWQGGGIGMNFLEAVCGLWGRGENRYGKPMTTLFNTSHPGLTRALRRRPGWRRVSAMLHGASKSRSRGTIARSGGGAMCGYGGHFRSVQGFRYSGGLA